MVVVTGREPDSRRRDGAMSSPDAEDDFLEPATPTATQAGHALPLLPQEFPEVVPLNIGGAYFTTRLSTLRRYEDTMLAAMFSGRHYIPTDAEGRYFIDRDGTHFGDVLNFLRSGDLPPQERVRAVYKEAQYYAIGPLLEQLENMQPLKGEKVRQAFLGLMPYYKDHLERIVEIARLRAVQRKAPFAKLKVVERLLLPAATCSSPPFEDVTIVAKAVYQVSLRTLQCLQPCLGALASPTFYQPSLLAGLSSRKAGIQISEAAVEDSLSQNRLSWAPFLYEVLHEGGACLMVLKQRLYSLEAEVLGTRIGKDTGILGEKNISLC
ncbi:BTB/POZ domain-containing protein KCTD7 isoform X2 [Tamandua tetradactyla]|uniref:BTB/POZ domain-containing protein KCTD7 isoform X2 n=1 Tax=Tamandua tetradactyla TaxID=48850 RepID=UPI00405480C9